MLLLSFGIIQQETIYGGFSACPLPSPFLIAPFFQDFIPLVYGTGGEIVPALLKLRVQYRTFFFSSALLLFFSSIFFPLAPWRRQFHDLRATGRRATSDRYTLLTNYHDAHRESRENGMLGKGAGKLGSPGSPDSRA